MSQNANDNQKKLHSQVVSSGGKARAEKLSPERRKEIAILANHSRACMKDLPKATHSGELIIGDTPISCAVLEDGRRVISESSMFEILGRKRKGRKRLDQIPAFLAANNLKPLITNSIETGSNFISFVGIRSGKAYGYEATLIPEICEIFLDARRFGILTETQLPTADKAEIILRSLAKVGITALIDEATGYQKDREQNELQKLFSKFLAKELQPWTKRFPPSFFENIKRMYGLEHLKGNPKFAGHLINRYIYSEISPEVLEELKKRNPLTDGGYRRHAHHQLLSADVGHPALEKQIMKVNTLMSASDTKEEFENLYEKTKR